MEILNNTNNKNKKVIDNENNILKRSHLKEINVDLNSFDKNTELKNPKEGKEEFIDIKPSYSVTHKTNKKIETKYKRQASENIVKKQES